MKITKWLNGLFVFSAVTFVSFAGQAQSGVATLLDPVEALELIQVEDLKYVGSFIPQDSESGIPSCLFRNSKVTVLYTYCRKNEAPALGFTVYSNVVERGNIRFYAEGDGEPVSQIKRADYADYMWRFFARTNTPGYNPNFTVKEYAAYYEKQGVDYHLGCHVWTQYGQGLISTCVAPHEAEIATWVPTGLSFWHNPPQAWYDVQKMFRKLVSKTRNF